MKLEYQEMKEASTSFEKVLVQNLHNELTPSLTDLLTTVPRWRLIQSALPYVLHSTANLLHNRKDLQNIGAIETTLLYILHWCLLDAAEECAENDSGLGIANNPFYYLFSIPTITLFVYLFAPLSNHLKDIDFKTNLRLENGVKLWVAMSECRHPESLCFTAHCRPKPKSFLRKASRKEITTQTSTNITTAKFTTITTIATTPADVITYATATTSTITSVSTITSAITTSTAITTTITTATNPAPVNTLTLISSFFSTAPSCNFTATTLPPFTTNISSSNSNNNYNSRSRSSYSINSSRNSNSNESDRNSRSSSNDSDRSGSDNSTTAAAVNLFIATKKKNDEARSSPKPTVSISYSEQTNLDNEKNWPASPKETIFPETIPEESSGAEDEHVVIFRLPSLAESEIMMENSKQVFTIFAGKASIFHVAMDRSNSFKSTSNIEQAATSIAGPEKNKEKSSSALKLGQADKAKKNEDKNCDSQNLKNTPSTCEGDTLDQARTANEKNPRSISSKDIRLATFLDVAVLRCLFFSQWQEEGIYWALQFLYNRLQTINDGHSIQQMPRRRSNSLPIPKIEVSIYYSPESKKKNNSKEFMDTPDAPEPSTMSDLEIISDLPYIGKIHQKSEGIISSISHVRCASERTKKRMKMADLKAFVETKLLSKSEKALEKIGQEESESILRKEQYCHRSLDTGDDHLGHPTLRYRYADNHDFRHIDKIQHTSNLIKGKSLPSLRYIGDSHVDREQSRFYSHSNATQNPIITVTEHTPDPSPEYFKRQASIDSQLDSISIHASKLSSERKPSLTRSQTDSNITYTSDEMPEAPGSSYYITKQGNIDYKIVLKAIHSVALKDAHSCTLRVCENILNLIELLLEMGILSPKNFGDIETSNQGSGGDINGNEVGANENGGGASKNNRKNGVPINDQDPRNDLEGRNWSDHALMINCVIRIIKHLGCPHGCGEGIRGPQANFCRSQISTILNRLFQFDSREFSKFLRSLVRDQSIPELLEFCHAYVGFCLESNSLFSPLNQKKIISKSPDTTTAMQSCYSTNFGTGLMNCGVSGDTITASALASAVSVSAAASYRHEINSYGSRSIESQIFHCIFKNIVTKFVENYKEIRSQENISMYCDIKQFITYIKEIHGGIFRRVALSGILDASDKPNKPCNSNIKTTRVIRHIYQYDDYHPEVTGDNSYTTIDDKGVKKVLLKKRSTSSTCASLLETELSEENIKISQSPSGNLRKKHHILTPRQSERNLEIGELYLSDGKSRKSSRFQIGGIVDWFRKEYGRTESTDSHESSESTEGTLTRQSSFHRVGYYRNIKSGQVMSQSFQKAKRRMEEKLIKIGLGKGKKKESFEEVPRNYFSRRNSMEAGDPSRESEFVVLKERKLIPRVAVFEGMQRFSFLLEICQPGSIPDQHLMAAILDLPHAPVVSRACLLLECAHLVHQCNKGHWPAWMKLNFPIFRPSVSMHSRHIPTGTRRMHMLQRAAGKLFYQWAEALSCRLEEFIIQDKQNVEQIIAIVSDENKQRELTMEDEEEDFLDEASINNYGSKCPVPLRMIACILLLEITSFLREMYQTLPKSNRLSMKERPPPWERMYSREANRRWSMALSSMGHSQTSAQSLQSITGDRETDAARSVLEPLWSLINPINPLYQPSDSITLDFRSERKISFVLHEPDNESEGSSKSTVTIQGEDNMQPTEKNKRVQAPPNRPFLLRRGTAGNPAGSFKRRSLKLRRGTKEGKEMEYDVYAVKRADSIQSKRKVSSLSDRSDTSEAGYCGEVSGEESPGILSDDQPPESPSDSNDTDDTNKSFPWLKTLVQFASSSNFYCSHQNFCHPYCHRRQMRACSRLMKSVKKIYGEEFGIINEVEFEGEKKNDGKKDKRSRKVSDQTSSQVSPIKRKDSVGKKFKIDKSNEVCQLGRHCGIIRDSSKDLAADQESEQSTGIPVKKQFCTINKSNKPHEEPPVILKYIKSQVKEAFHAPLATLIKGAVIMSDDLFIDMLSICWELLLESNQEVAASAASLFIIAAVRAPNQASELMNHNLQHSSTSMRINAILKFQVLWKLRYQVWPRMEDGAHVTFKVPPPGIEFTLPSPKIGIESLPVVDPPWMPLVKTKVEEVTINQERHRSLVTATKTRKKQQTELIKKALQAQDDKKREERENFLITTIPITVQAAYEPSPVGDDHDEGNVDDDIGGGGSSGGGGAGGAGCGGGSGAGGGPCTGGGSGDPGPRNTTHHGQSALSLFPSSLCSAIIQIINLLDDAAVTEDGNSVYEVAYQVIWSCLVEDSALFFRYILERLTRDKQELMFKILRHLIRFVPKLPQQAAFALYNYIIGYVMFYVRSPHEEGQKLIGTALSILWMVVHSVHGIMFKDLKQILRKEQCDASILLTANVPSAKKIIVHGPQDPDAGGIPSQFPVQEDTQFFQILRESLDFFGIDEQKHKEYFLVDHKTHQIHNPSSYVRDYYFFKRSQYPQLELVHMKPENAFNALQKQELLYKFVEIGKVLLTWAILKNVDMVVQRVVFLHEELMKLPAFPRKALEADLDLYRGGEIGRELLGLDVMHKFMWVRLIARMFEAMAGNFAYSGDIHLFLNVLNGALILHSEDSCILRYVVATYINAAHNFKNIFSSNGYLLIMPSLLQLYAMHQTNKLVTTTVEYAVKQFYMMNRKPFILQMFGSVSTILDTDTTSVHGDAHKVSSNCLFNLLLSLETPSPDPLNIGELVKEEKPLKALDFCYHDENEMVTVLDCIALCVMVIAYAADSVRGQQMLMILEAVLPCYIQQIQLPTYEKDGKSEKEIINQLAIAVKTLVNNSETLTKCYNGPQKSSPEHKGSSQRNYGKGPYSPGFDFEDELHSVRYIEHTKTQIRNSYDRENEDSESFHKNEFRKPRDTLLNIVGDFIARCSVRLIELTKKQPDGKNIELLDSKCHIRLADIAHSLLKMSPYDPETMACRGLKRYMNDVLPSTEWSNDDMKPALIVILRRLDKTFSKIYKKALIRRNTDWQAASDLLKGVYETLYRYPYISHFQNLKTLLITCQALIIGDTTLVEVTSSATAALMSKIPPQNFCSTVLRLIALHIISLGDVYTLENVCNGQAMFASQLRTENLLLNLLIPLFLRIGTGRKDAPTLRQTDISFALAAVLNTLWPSSTKTTPIVVQNLKTATDMRTGSLTFAIRDQKISTKLSLSLYKVAFLALKIMIICFEIDLKNEWLKIYRTMRLLNKRNEASIHLWSFLEFVVTHRTVLYIQMLPFILNKIGQPPISEHERNMQSIIRGKINGHQIIFPKSRGTLLTDLLHELRNLKEEIDDRKFDELQTEPKRSVVDMHSNLPNSNDGQPRTQRPSLLIDLLTGDLGSRVHVNRTPVETPGSHSTLLHSLPQPVQSIYSSNMSKSSLPIHYQGSISLTHGNNTKAIRRSIDGGIVSLTTLKPKLSVQGSISSINGGSVTIKTSSDIIDVNPEEIQMNKPIFTAKSGTNQLIPMSPPVTTITSNEDNICNELQDRPRLQRSMGQSKKTFRLRKSRRTHIEVPHFKLDLNESDQSHQSIKNDPGINEYIPIVTRSSSIESSAINLPLSETSSVRSRRSFSIRVRDFSDRGTNLSPGDYHQLNFYQHQSDVSLDDDTSSTSGYRESYSMQLMSIDGKVRLSNEPPLASPDLNDMPSTSSTITNYLIGFDGSSPECSLNGSINSGERTALLNSNQSKKASENSPLIMSNHQINHDEDTLI